MTGTFVLVTVVSLAGGAGPMGPLAIGSALMAMVYMGGHISGAHYNPAVSFGMFVRGKMAATEMAAYWAVQLVGAAIAVVVAYLVSGHSSGIHPGAKVQVVQALAVEVLFTAVLVLVIINVAASKATQGNSFYGLAIGFTIAAAAFVGGPISGGAFNPAVGFGATLGSAMFAAGSWSDLWIFVVGPLAGGVIGAGINYLQVRSPEAL